MKRGTELSSHRRSERETTLCAPFSFLRGSCMLLRLANHEDMWSQTPRPVLSAVKTQTVVGILSWLVSCCHLPFFIFLFFFLFFLFLLTRKFDLAPELFVPGMAGGGLGVDHSPGLWGHWLPHANIKHSAVTRCPSCSPFFPVFQLFVWFVFIYFLAPRAAAWTQPIRAWHCSWWPWASRTCQRSCSDHSPRTRKSPSPRTSVGGRRTQSSLGCTLSPGQEPLGALNPLLLLWSGPLLASDAVPKVSSPISRTRCLTNKHT